MKSFGLGVIGAILLLLTISVFATGCGNFRKENFNMEPIKEKYTGYVNTIQKDIDITSVDANSYSLSDGCYHQLVSIELDDVYYNIQFSCTDGGHEEFQIQVSKQDQQSLVIDDLQVLIFLIQEFSSEKFSDEYLQEKCVEAINTKNGEVRLKTDFYIENIGDIELVFHGHPR